MCIKLGTQPTYLVKSKRSDTANQTRNFVHNLYFSKNMLMYYNLIRDTLCTVSCIPNYGAYKSGMEKYDDKVIEGDRDREITGDIEIEGD